MNPAVAFLEWFTRPRVVLGLRVLWDFGLGIALLLGFTFLSASRVELIGAGTVAVGVWTLAAEVRTRKVSP